MRTHISTVAGGPDDFMLVRHLTVRGDQREIGRALAEEVRTRHGWTPRPADRRVSRARRTWFEQHWPQQHARMAGIATALGVHQDDRYVDMLSGLPEGSGCSATWSPPPANAEGHGLFGRNYDFFTLGVRQLGAQFNGDGDAPADEPPMCSRPYLITTVPEDGPANTVLTMNSLDGCMEGINEHGLAVALLIADVQHAAPPGPTSPQVGLDSVQLPRFLLDTCADVEQAKQALLGAKHYDYGTPLHYLIADAAGDAFVWERGTDGAEHIVEADGPLCVTNHPLHRHPDPANLPEDTPDSMLTYRRTATLAKRTGGGGMSAARIRAALDEVHFDVPTADAAGLPVRTLWRTVFDVHARTMHTRFYLGDNPDGTLRYSPELELTPTGG